MLHALMKTLLWLVPIAAALVALVALVGRNRTADEHDLSDYHEPAPDNDPTCRYAVADGKVSLKAWATARRVPLEDILPAVTASRDILPPAPPGMNAGSPLYAGMLFDAWHPESPADTADRFLRELRDEARAELAGVA